MPEIWEFQWQRGLAANWAIKNPVLRDGEPGLESDTRKFKIGDGVSRWLDLDYYLDENHVVALIEDYLGIGGGGPDPRIGDMDDLTTLDKVTIVAAINELNGIDVPLTLLYENAKAG